MKEVRLFKVEFESQDPIIVTGEKLLTIAKEQSNEEFPLYGDTIDDAFSYLTNFDNIQECELSDDLKQILYQSQQDLKVAVEALELIKHTYTKTDDYCCSTAVDISTQALAKLRKDTNQ